MKKEQTSYITIECSVKVPQDLMGIMDDQNKEKEYEMKFLDYPISVDISVKLNPIAMLYIANIEFIHRITRQGKEYIDLLVDNYGMVLPTKLVDQLLEAIDTHDAKNKRNK